MHGSVLVDDKLSGGVPTVYFAAGRSSRIDGGIRLYALEVKTGKLLHKADVTVPGGRGAGIIRQSVLPDILSLQKDTVWMRGLGVDKNLAPVEDVPHLFAPRGFLDDTWWHRTYWLYGTADRRRLLALAADVGNVVPAGRLLVFDGGQLHLRLRPHGLSDGRRACPSRRHEGLQTVRRGPHAQAADAEEDAEEETSDYAAAGKSSGPRNCPFVARSIVLTRDALLVAGGESLTESAASHGPGTFWVASREDGSRRSACALPAPPVLDGMALTDAGVFVSTIDGSVACLRTKNDE